MIQACRLPHDLPTRTRGQCDRRSRHPVRREPHWSRRTDITHHAPPVRSPRDPWGNPGDTTRIVRHRLRGLGVPGDPRGPRLNYIRMRISTIIIVSGLLLFVFPLPGTFALGGILVLAGVVARLLGA